MLIGLLGKKRVGKDTVAEYLEKEHKFIRITMAEPLKDGCKMIFGFNDEQLYGDLKETDDDFWNVSPRKVMQYLGTDVFRKEIHKIIPDIGNNFWVKCVENKIMRLRAENPNINIVVSDIRFENELEMIQRLKGVVIKIDRPNINNLDNHESEADIDLIDGYDYHLLNDDSIAKLHVCSGVIIDKIKL